MLALIFTLFCFGGQNADARRLVVPGGPHWKNGRLSVSLL